ncbi:hypothetical protein ABEB36_010988 [Hypothenemus hampei]|uniref:Protein SHQ1 homolog n=1 Tax=Hypothenemus hampei TaxID=57062 RepID=A0ABD1EED5_HYPHA
MITPNFQLSQTHKTVTMIVRAPHCHLDKLEVKVQDDVLLFKCTPYFLRLTLPGKLVDCDENRKVSFDVESGEFTFTYSKLCPGEHFDNLELIPNIIIPTQLGNYPQTAALIQEVSESNQTVTSPVSITSGWDYRYGFVLQNSIDFNLSATALDEVFDVDPCKTTLHERHKLKIQYEQGKFNVHHYIADYLDNGEILDLRAQEHTLESDLVLNSNEMNFLDGLPGLPYDLTVQQITWCYTGVLDILFAYCYDQRTTHFEGNIESGWTISKLAASLCWCEVFDTPRDAIISAFRRSLIYPLYRNFELSQTVFSDLKALISCQERHILRAFIQIYGMFLHGDRNVLNNLYIKSYLSYIMKWDPDHWKATVNEVLQMEITKQEIGLNLEQIENSLIPNSALATLSIRDESEDEIDSDDEESSSCSSDDDSTSGWSSSDPDTSL